MRIIKTDKEAEKWAIREAKNITKRILADTHVVARLFGSRSAGTPRRFSDIDIALETKGKPVPAEIMDQLSESFEQSLIPFKVDLVDMHTVSPAVKTRIKLEGKLWNV